MGGTDVGAGLPLVIVGAGGLGREVLDIVHAANRSTSPAVSTWHFLGFVANDPPMPAARNGLATPWLGPFHDALPKLPRGTHFVMGIGDPATRRSLAGSCKAMHLSAGTLIHPSAVLGSDITLGPGTVICANATLTTNISIGDHSLVNIGSTIGHDCSIGAFTTINPLACVSGSVSIGDEALIGAGATILQGLRVGARACIGAGAVVTRDVPSGATVVGIPARQVTRRSVRQAASKR